MLASQSIFLHSLTTLLYSVLVWGGVLLFVCLYVFQVHGYFSETEYLIANTLRVNLKICFFGLKSNHSFKYINPINWRKRNTEESEILELLNTRNIETLK